MKNIHTDFVYLYKTLKAIRDGIHKAYIFSFNQYSHIKNRGFSRNLCYIKNKSSQIKFSKENTYMIQKRKMETTKNEDTVKLVLPFSYFLWMLGTNPDAPIEKTMQQESQAKQEN